MTRTGVDYGDGAVGRLAQVVAELGARRVLLVTGGASFAASGASRLLAPLESVARVERWADFRPNTDVEDLAVGIEVARDFDADMVIGIGGGSVMDMAKLICAYRGCASVADLHAAIRSGEPIPERRMSLLLAPTTSGSGSEATHFAVVYIGEEKFSIAGSAMLPDGVALEPSLAVSGSPHQRATSGIDATCQAIESLWAVGANAQSRRNARFALHLLIRHIEDFVRSPTPQTARAMQLGSHLAGRAINISKTTAAHALSYGITKQFGVDHGNAAALTLGQFIEAHAAPDPALQPAADHLVFEASMQIILKHLSAKDGPAARRNFRELLDRIGLAWNLEEVGCTSDDLDGLASSVNLQRLGNNPVIFDNEGLEQILVNSLT
jgi:alcohol dehydrogenase